MNKLSEEATQPLLAYIVDQEARSIWYRVMDKYEPEVVEKWRHQDSVLEELSCSDLTVGALLSEVSIPAFLKYLRLSPVNYALIQPNSDVSSEDRATWLGRLEEHICECEKCAAKAKIDGERDKEMEELLESYGSELATAMDFAKHL